MINKDLFSLNVPCVPPVPPSFLELFKYCPIFEVKVIKSALKVDS